MYSRPESDEAFIRRMLPSSNTDRADRAQAWADWQECFAPSLNGFVRARNSTAESDEDLVQDALICAYLSVECGQYQPREGVPFIAYVKGIARNKIREARRRTRRLVNLDEIPYKRDGALPRQPEDWLEQHEQREWVRSGLADLPQSHAQVLMRFLNGQSTDQIAEDMDISADLVRQHKCRGLKVLKERTLSHFSPPSGTRLATAA